MMQWRHHLEGARYKILIQYDHKNLEYFQTPKVLSRRQARWTEILSAYDYKIEHLEATKNPADRPSRRPDYAQGCERPSARLLATASHRFLFANAVVISRIDKDLFAAIIEAQKTDRLATNSLRKLAGTEEDHVMQQAGSVGGHVTEPISDEHDWAVSGGALTYEGRVYVPDSPRLRSKVTALHHDNPESGYFGGLKTAELVSRNFHWPALTTSVRQYVAGCEVCHRTEAARHPRYAVNMSIEPPSQPWESVTMDFVTDLPKSTASAYTGILVVVDRLTKMAIYLPCRKDVDSPELARMFSEEVICKHVVPSNIITDRGSQFTSRFWNRVFSHLSIDHRLSTSFHPQTDGQTERQNQTMSGFCYIRAGQLGRYKE
jgi:transposase InsO family protein